MTTEKPQNEYEGMDENRGADSIDSPPDSGAALSPLESVTRERDDLRDKLARALAECSNVAKRLGQQHTQSLKHASMSLAKSMLPILDGLDRTIKSIEESGRDDPIAEGVKLLRDEFMRAFRANGIEPIESMGRPFDPGLHEALLHDPKADAPPGTVTVEYEKGYTLHDRVLRPAKVVVAAPKSESDGN